ncbi:hypothetical protein SLEP1_g54875 [Rubroshorea leprosula]|uniref:Uncharacterized protein n=1 Tax=Rubroshorea leprosula TaxID=152421 RepID=A0AAV5MDS2_9ROSI|nr:hypothetical protein SLEP1_g54875 [Rubroshorea leprosula]
MLRELREIFRIVNPQIFRVFHGSMDLYLLDPLKPRWSHVGATLEPRGSHVGANWMSNATQAIALTA